MVVLVAGLLKSRIEIRAVPDGLGQGVTPWMNVDATSIYHQENASSYELNYLAPHCWYSVLSLPTDSPPYAPPIAPYRNWCQAP